MLRPSLCVVAFALSTSAWADPPAKEVIVTNSAAQKIPVAVQGTVTVGGNVTTTIAPDQTVTLSKDSTVQIAPNQSITIGGTPTVQVGNFPSAGTPSRALVSGDVFGLFPDVPAGKRLTISQVSCHMNFAFTGPVGGQPILEFDIGGAPVYFPVPQHVGSSPSASGTIESWATSEHVNIALDAGETLTMTWEVFQVTDTQGGAFDCAFVGMLTDK
jgi:hypothetical protein